MPHGRQKVERFIDVVRHEDRGHALRFDDAHDLFLHFHAREGVERAEGFIHQQDFDLIGERAGLGYALRHAAGELRRPCPFESLQASERHKISDNHLLVALEPARVKTETDILINGEPREERIVLKDPAPGVVPARYRFAANRNIAAREPVQARNGLEERRLAAAARPQHTEQLAFINREIDVLERHRVTVARAEHLRGSLKYNPRLRKRNFTDALRHYSRHNDSLVPLAGTTDLGQLAHSLLSNFI